MINRSHEVPLGDIVDVRRVARATGSNAETALSQIGVDLACRQHVLRPARDISSRHFWNGWSEDFRLSDFDLSIRDGQISLRFDGLWTETTMWEIYALSAIDELKTRASLKQLTEFELDILYARAKTRLWEKMARLRGVPGLTRKRFWNAAASQLSVAGVSW